MPKTLGSVLVLMHTQTHAHTHTTVGIKGMVHFSTKEPVTKPGLFPLNNGVSSYACLLGK